MALETKRTCPECNSKYEPTRKDQKFCTTSCRWNAWRKKQKKGQPVQDNTLSGTPSSEIKKTDLFSSLRGVPEPIVMPEPNENVANLKEAERIVIPEKPKEEVKKVLPAGPVETKEYREALGEKARVDTFGKRVISDLQRCDEAINEARKNLAVLSDNKPNNSKYKHRSIDVDDLFGAENFNREVERNYKIEQANKRLTDVQLNRLELLKELDKANMEMNAVVNRLKTIPRYESPKPQRKTLSEIMANLRQKKALENKKKENLPAPVTSKPIEEDLSETAVTNVSDYQDTFDGIEEPNTNSKLVSSRDLRKIKYNCFPFTGKWKLFFGEPSYTFHLAVHGKPGEGKSTFCVQFADYLAKNFGRAVYISGEEGLSKTVQDKVINNGIDNPYLFFADIKSFEEIKTEIENRYHFIFIDSLDTLRIDAQKLKELKELFPQSAFITISQSTKDGKMRGSLEITHDTDIAVKVENGMAATTKNRFQARGTEFNVFEETKVEKGRHIEKDPKSKPFGLNIPNSNKKNASGNTFDADNKENIF